MGKFRVDPRQACQMAAQTARSWRISYEERGNPPPKAVADAATWAMRRDLERGNLEPFRPERGMPSAPPEVVVKAWYDAVLQAAKGGCCTKVKASYPYDSKGNLGPYPDEDAVDPCMKRARRKR